MREVDRFFAALPPTNLPNNQPTNLTNLPLHRLLMHFPYQPTKINAPSPYIYPNSRNELGPLAVSSGEQSYSKTEE